MEKKEKGVLSFLYTTVPGRAVLKVLTARPVSKIAGAFCDCPLSKPLIKGFVKKNGIDLSEYVTSQFSCFNDCFTRKIKPELRPVCMAGDALVSPCDGLLSAYQIEKGMVFPAKQSSYSVASMLRDDALAGEFEGGTVLVIRLCVQHYHRYCYLDSGTKGENKFIKGCLHTVRPIALENRPVFCENCREYTVMDTENFGRVIQCEIGAMLVGRILNHHGAGQMKRGEEKGMFLYGGSTVVLLLQKDAATLPESYFEATQQGVETPVKYGEKIGTKRC
ncbi:MAG: phosphatidylserine decarboxylase [Faecousia sp.]